MNTLPRTRALASIACAALLCVFAQSSHAATIYAVTTGSALISFDSSTPGTVNSVPITGLQLTESVYGIDFRPKSGQLYALAGTQAGPSFTCQIYTINPDTGVATDLPGIGTLLLGTKAGFDFNPAVDRIRVTTNDEANARFHPDTGDLVQIDASLTSGNLVEVAYDRSFPGTTVTTLFGLDATSDMLVTVGGIDGSPSPNGGEVTNVGSLGFDTDDFSALDFGGASLYAILRVGDLTQLHLINPISGDATLVGNIGGNPVIFGGMAIQAEPLIVAAPVKIKLDFDDPALDLIVVSGVVPIDAGFSVVGQPITLNVGGVTKTFTLDSKGKAKVGTDQISVKIKAKGGIVAAQGAKFKATLKKGDFADDFLDEGLTNATEPGKVVTVLISLNFAGDFRQSSVSLFYKATLGIKGQAKL